MTTRAPRSSTGASTTTAQTPSIWSSLLDAASTSKRLPTKTLLVLGGSPHSQREFLANFTQDPSSNRNRPLNQPRNPSNPLANDLALGYTYHDVLDADQEDVLARVGCYMVADPADEALVPLARKVVLSKDAVEGGMCVVVLLDWARPWEWLKKLRGWVRWVRRLVEGADDEVKEAMETELRAWRERKRGPGAEGGASGERPGTAGSDVAVPLGPGEWDSPLGLPLCVVAQNAEAIEGLERERGWREEEFDFVLQVLRTVLLKHGGGLVYTMASPQAAAPMRDLVHATLGIQSLLKRSQLKHNVIDRDQVLVPPNWDSWGKIRVLREGLDVEEVSKTWDLDIDAAATPADDAPGSDSSAHGDTERPSVLALYTAHIPSPRGALGADLIRSHAAGGTSVSAPDNQAFLEQQRAILDQLQAEDEKERAARPKPGNAGALSSIVAATTEGAGGRVVEDHIGPVQFNFGGVNVDAEVEIRRIEEREASRTTGRDGAVTPTTPTPTKPEIKSNLDNEGLSKFFSALKAKTGSAANSPKA